MAKKSPVRKVIKKDGNQQAIVSDEIISRVRELAWKGQHAKNIDLATQALSTPRIKPSEQMNLLDLRAESHLALLNFDAAEKDVRQMESVAKAANKPALKAQALIRKPHLRAWQDREQDTRRTATAALKLARQSKQKYLEAESLFWLAWFGPNDVYIRLAQQAADLYLSLDNPSRAGWALNLVA